MRVVFAPHAYWPSIGGAERYTQGLAEGLAGLGHEVHVVVADVDDPEAFYELGHQPVGRPEETIGGVAVHRLPYVDFAYRRMGRMLGDEQGDSILDPAIRARSWVIVSPSSSQSGGDPSPSLSQRGGDVSTEVRRPHGNWSTPPCSTRTTLIGRSSSVCEPVTQCGRGHCPHRSRERSGFSSRMARVRRGRP